MKPFTIVILILISVGAFSQQDTTITYLDVKGNPTTETNAARYVMQHREKGFWKQVTLDANDNKIEWAGYFSDSAATQHEGLFESFHKNGNKKQLGRYLKNKKTGLWMSWSDTGEVYDSIIYKNDFVFGIGISRYHGHLTDSLIFGENGDGYEKRFWMSGSPSEYGYYKNGKKSGLWTYYYDKGGKSEEINYVADSAMSSTCFDQKGQLQKNCPEFSEAQYKGGDKGWLRYITNRLSSITLPTAYYDGKIYGTVYILFVINTNGRIQDVTVVSSVDPVLDQIAKDVVRESPDWKPAMMYNRPVQAFRKQPITFAKVQ